jgi:hypothetical protein
MRAVLVSHPQHQSSRNRSMRRMKNTRIPRKIQRGKRPMEPDE